jgi:hypothetical protein
MYHDPCHTPMKTYQPLEVARKLTGQAGAAQRPLLRGVGHVRRLRPGHRHPGALPQGGGDGEGARQPARRRVQGRGEDPHRVPVLPAGLQRYDPDADTTADYIVVEMAAHLLGPDWMREFVDKARHGGIERVLL